MSRIRDAWPEVEILIRADSGFAREELMAWCEGHRVHYVLGLARNPRLERALAPAFEEAEALCAQSGEPERVYAEWFHSTLETWSRERRVIGKAEITVRGENPRFVVTSLSADEANAQARARCQTIRLRLFKIGARVRVTRRKIWVFLSSACPHQDLFAHAYDRLIRAGPLPA